MSCRAEGRMFPTPGVEERELELEAKISLVQHTFIEHLLYVPGARKTEKCARGPLTSRSLISTWVANTYTNTQSMTHAVMSE